MRILALDQASRITGWAIFDENKLERYGTINVGKYYELGERLYQIRQQIEHLIDDEHIDVVILEDIYLDESMMNNIQTFKALAEVFGVIYELCVEMKKPVEAVLPKVWRATLGIKGKTRPEQKKNDKLWVQNTYNITPSEDECDAICIGAHYNHSRVNDWGE